MQTRNHYILNIPARTQTHTREQQRETFGRMACHTATANSLRKTKMLTCPNHVCGMLRVKARHVYTFYICGCVYRECTYVAICRCAMAACLAATDYFVSHISARAPRPPRSPNRLCEPHATTHRSMCGRRCASEACDTE